MRLLWRVEKFECLSIRKVSSVKRVGVPNTALGRGTIFSLTKKRTVPKKETQRAKLAEGTFVLEFSLFLNQNFSETSEIQTFFPPNNRWSPKKKKKKCLHRNWDWFFGLNRKFIRPKTGGLQKKKKKKVFTEIETDFSAKIGNSGYRLRWFGLRSRL